MDAQELRALRKGLGLNQAEMAAQLGFTEQYVGMLERGERPINNRAAALVRAIGRPPLDRAPRCADPMERRIEMALIEAGIPFVSEMDDPGGTRLDFELLEADVAIEVKRFYTPRSDQQMSRRQNIIVAQGEHAVEALANFIRGSVRPTARKPCGGG